MSYVTYTKVGPFRDNGAPGIDHNFLNGLETMLAAGWFDSAITSNGAGVMTLLGLIASGAIKPNAAATSTNGNTAGTVKLWQPFQGEFKLAMLFFSGFRNAGANQDLVLPTPFTNGGFFAIGNIVNPTDATGSGISFLASAAAISINEYSSAGSVSAGTNAKAMNIGFIPAAFDTIRILGTSNWTGAATDFMAVIGS